MSYQKQKDDLLNKLKSHLAKIDDSIETLAFSIQAYDGWTDKKLGEPIGFNEYEIISLLSDSNCDMVNSALFPCNELEKFVNSIIKAMPINAVKSEEEPCHKCGESEYLYDKDGYALYCKMCLAHQ